MANILDRFIAAKISLDREGNKKIFSVHSVILGKQKEELATDRIH